jgi:1-acyl-sn-glycerol-3-phosphate acyltransferase
MITANHQAWAHAIFRPYLRGLIRRRFTSLRLLGDIPAIPPDAPILLIPNHSTWWDGFFPYMLNSLIFCRKFHVMMLERRLREFWFFRYVGSYSINQESPKGIAESLRYTADLLEGENLVTVFPQGALAPFGRRPLGFNRGIERVARLAAEAGRRFAIVPLAMRCEFLEEEKPHAFLLCGAPIFHEPDSPPLHVEEIERVATLLLDDIERRIAAGEEGKRLL